VPAVAAMPCEQRGPKCHSCLRETDEGTYRAPASKKPFEPGEPSRRVSGYFPWRDSLGVRRDSITSSFALCRRPDFEFGGMRSAQVEAFDAREGPG